MAKVKVLHERTFGGKPAKSLRVYDDPFGGNEMCVELAFLDGEIEYVCIGSGRPGILSSGICYEVDSETVANSVAPDDHRTRHTGQSDLVSGPEPGNGLGSSGVKKAALWRRDLA